MVDVAILPVGIILTDVRVANDDATPNAIGYVLAVNTSRAAAVV